ncbi:LysR family transcriptional regulator [Donghicola mangrovi]|uniref:LysR family transcriptional regulator n=1 Tax=Donghicola mangrovi TaxID=2729614 RepID=A0A850QF43_9RHOB|nr:LysR family transcriptional regulator [Donghicola mangrovi]NVO25580.1 LysR family transcriptional regulator [Donghicola mangrovi]
MKLDSEHLEILAMIVERGGLTEGAEALGKSQPSVSRTISNLEKRLGMPLFELGRRPLQPTHFGRALAEIGLRIHNLNKEAQRLAYHFSKGYAGHIRIGGTPIFMDGVISHMLADFQERADGVQFDQSYGYLDSLLGNLRNKTLDMAILPLRDDQTPMDCDFRPLIPGRNVIACRSGHPLARKGPITLKEIDAYSWVAPPANSPLFRDLKGAITSIGSENFKFTFSGGTLASIQSFLVRTDCLTVLPYSVVYLMKSAGQIVSLPIKVSHPDRKLGILTRKGEDLTPMLKTFISFLEEQCENLECRMARETRIAQGRP